MNKYKAITKEQLNAMPQDVIINVHNILKVYNEAHVIFENSKYHVSAGVCLKKSYAADFKAIGTAYAEDIFTVNERIINYANEFKDFSPLYKGVRNYSIFCGDTRGRVYTMRDGALIIA